MIRLSNIHKYFFKGTNREVHAVRGINLDIDQGTFTVLVGSNGSGKSTLLNLIAGSIAPDTGRIFLEGADVTEQLDHRRSKHVSRVFQDPLAGTADELTVLENFRLASLRTRHAGLQIGMHQDFRDEVTKRVASLQLGLEHKLDQPIGTLSGGQRQALTLLMTVMDRSKILLMDEPSSALDPATAEIVMQLAADLSIQHGLTTVLVTHNLKDAEAYGDRIIMMENGTIKKDLSGPAKKQLSRSEIFAWF